MEAYKAMWDRVEEETGGKIKVEIYDLGQLGNCLLYTSSGSS